METADRIFIYHQNPGPRLFYIAGFLKDSLGIDFIVTNDRIITGPLIVYGKGPATEGIRIPESGFLSEAGIRQFVPVVEIKDHIYLFPMEGDYDLSFDVFSALFYLLSRYEEYLPFEADRYGRFELKQSFAFKNGFHLEPLADQWLMVISALLRKRFPELIIPPKKFRFVSTFDIDSPWAYKNRKPGRNLPGLALDILKGNSGNVSKRREVLKNNAQDPFDVYSFIRRTEDQYSFKSLFFFLLADKGRKDVNRSLHSGAFRELLRGLSADHETGIHPSFYSNSKNKILKNEIARYLSFTGKPAECSRQHYLILRIPETYQRLIQYGIKEDYSMGYASGPGFRAGTTLPFKFYDLTTEKQTDLTVHPFAVMDVTLMQYLQMDADQATGTIGDLIHKIRQVNGVFISLWHNESLSDWGKWKGWRKVFIEMVQRAVQYA